MATVDIYFGVMAEPIMQQIKEQGLPVPPIELMGHIQRDADAITRLKVRGLLPEAQAAAARRRLMRKIGEAVRAHAAPGAATTEG